MITVDVLVNSNFIEVTVDYTTVYKFILHGFTFNLVSYTSKGYAWNSLTGSTKNKPVIPTDVMHALTEEVTSQFKVE